LGGFGWFKEFLEDLIFGEDVDQRLLTTSSAVDLVKAANDQFDGL
jgi:hypothetical protein